MYPNIIYIPGQVYLVTGGGGLQGLTDTTETLTEGHTAWDVVATARLEVPLYGLRGITMDNVVYMIGRAIKAVRMGWWGIISYGLTSEEN